ncbi:General odorant-binding protein 19a [Orchesella cincta]|uniref:General odorant-binding protein 19a n=1 Tax=Orchesella cincta TaxID=48709 RepID=A0A1D2MEL2_ORCCI|nr:General odorant-binding protein 19a [Orchesella cincta]
MENSKALVLLLAIGFCCVASTLGESCMGKLTQSANFVVAQTACVKNLKLNVSDIESLTPATLKENHFDDKCFTNCTLESMNAYHNGTFKKEAILEQLKAVVPETDHENLSKVVDTCVEKATQKPGGHKHKHNKNGNEKKTKDIKLHAGHMGKCSCKRAAKFVSCMMENDIMTC